MKTTLPILLLLATLLGAYAPAQENPPPPAPGTATETRAPDREAAPARADALLAFGFDLYRPHAAQLGAGENLALSPACLANLLEALLAGADGKTEAEL